MASVKAFLGTIRFPPNPYRNFDNSLSTNLPVTGQFAPSGRGTLAAGNPVAMNGNAVNGQLLFRQVTNLGWRVARPAILCRPALVRT